MELATRKALDLPLDDDDVNITTSSGMTWKHLAGTAAIIAASLGGAYLLAQPDVPTPLPAVPAATPADAAYEIIFYDSAGNVIPLDRRAVTTDNE